jgi:thiol-disulfide isomerase/thioredoxin
MKNILIMFYLLIASVSLYGCENQETNNNIPEVKESSASITSDTKKAADFSLKTLEGKEVKLSDYKGKVVIIDFWATWCPPCRKGIPDLVELQKEFKDKLVVIGISLDQQNTINDLAPFMKQYAINYPVVLGNEKVVRDYGNIQAIPTSFIIDQAGNIVDTHVGLVPKSTYTNKINQLLKKS